jgi:hypothetical protein
MGKSVREIQEMLELITVARGSLPRWQLVRSRDNWNSQRLSLSKQTHRLAISAIGHLLSKLHAKLQLQDRPSPPALALSRK